jgi:hypothetical protein
MNKKEESGGNRKREEGGRGSNKNKNASSGVCIYGCFAIR